MLNFYYWYSIIWSSVLVLYELKWSIYNKEINNELMFFLIVSITLSLVLGRYFKKILQYPDDILLKDDSIKGTIIICALAIMTFIYAGHIPLFSIILGYRAYGDFEVLPFIQPILINYIIYRVFKLTFYFLETNNKKKLYEIICILSVVMLMFFKGTMIFCLFGMLNLFIAKHRKKSKLSLIYILKIISIIFLVFYFNGGLANLRTGLNWNDGEFIAKLGGINAEKIPMFLPNQLLWGYVYITSPLANLNLCIQSYNYNFEFEDIFVSTIPLFISKRLFETKMFIYDINNFSMYHEALNACTGYVNSVIAGGIYGIYYFYIILMLQIIIVSYSIKKNKITSPYYAINVSVITAFLFFYNTLTTAATSLLIYIVLFSIISQKIKLK